MDNFFRHPLAYLKYLFVVRPRVSRQVEKDRIRQAMFEVYGPDFYRIEVTDVKVLNPGVRLTVGRPGILIGKQGKDLDALEKALGYRVDIVESKIWN